MEVLSQSEFSDQPAAFELTRQEPRLWLLQCTVLKFYFFTFQFTSDVETRSLPSVFLFTYVCNQHTYNNFFHFITVKHSSSPDSWSTTLVLLCSGERKFLATPWVKYCRLSQVPKYHFFSALAAAPALKLHSIFLHDNGPCHTSRSSTTFCIVAASSVWCSHCHCE